MGKLMGIDFGAKRTGIAVSDDLQIIASGLCTVDTKELFTFLKRYFSENKVDAVALGDPKRLNNEAAQSAPLVLKFETRFKKEFPEISIHRIDERFTSKMAFQTMIDSGLKKKQRQNKALIDEISATIILQSYMESSSR